MSSVKTFTTHAGTPPAESGSGGVWNCCMQRLPLPGQFTESTHVGCAVVDGRLQSHDCLMFSVQCGPTAVASLRHVPIPVQSPSLLHGECGAPLQLGPTVQSVSGPCGPSQSYRSRKYPPPSTSSKSCARPVHPVSRSVAVCSITRSRGLFWQRH